MYRGYVKLWRKSIEGGWLSNAKLWTFWCWCLMKASHKEYDLVVGLQKVHLMPGDFVFGLKAASKELKMPIQPIRTILDFLKISQNITLKTTNKFSIISIINWDTYQSDENEINTQINKPLTNEQQTTNNKQTLKELKNVKNTNIGVFILPEKIKKEVWEAYLEMRRSIKKPATKHAQNLIIKKLMAMKDDPNLVLEQSIVGSWQSVYELKIGGNGDGRAKFTSTNEKRSVLQQDTDREAERINQRWEQAKAASGTLNLSKGNTP
jgi:hypothetical protein